MITKPKSQHMLTTREICLFVHTAGMYKLKQNIVAKSQCQLVSVAKRVLLKEISLKITCKAQRLEKLAGLLSLMSQLSFPENQA